MYLRQLWANPFARQQQHLQLREAFTTYLTANAPDTISWSSTQLAAQLATYPLLQAKSKLLDMGCGSGHYLEALIPKFVDFGVGLDKTIWPATKNKTLTKLIAQFQVQLVQGNALTLPFTSSTFGAVMANRMLNQTGNIACVLSEVRRVLLPGGLLFVVTADRKVEPLLRTIHEASLQKLAFPSRLYTHSTLPNQRLNYENGPRWLQAAGFMEVQLKDYERRLHFESLATAMELYATGLIFQKSQGFDELDIVPANWATLYLAVQQKLSEILNRQGYIQISEGATLFISQNP